MFNFFYCSNYYSIESLLSNIARFTLYFWAGYIQQPISYSTILSNVFKIGKNCKGELNYYLIEIFASNIPLFNFIKGDFFQKSLFN